jgi:hypothetical protein
MALWGWREDAARCHFALTSSSSVNWLIYIYAVNSNQAESSLGYFINPLVYPLRCLFLGERRLARWPPRARRRRVLNCHRLWRDAWLAGWQLRHLWLLRLAR